MIDEEQIRLFNEIMSGKQIEGSQFPSVYEVPSISKPDPNAEKLKQILEGREQLREKQRQEEFAARPLPEKIEGAREAAGFLGSTIGRGVTYPFVELYGRATDQPNLGSGYLEGAELPKTDLGLEYTIRTGDALEPLAKAMDVAKIPHTPFTVELLPLANMPFALSKLNIARAGQKAAEDVSQATKAATQVGTKAVETVQETLATPPVGAISLDTLGFSSRLSEGVDKLQDKGTGSQFLAQLSKMKGVPVAEIKVTGLDEYLKNTPKVTKQEVQDYLETNRLQLIEDERIAGAGQLTDRDLNTLPREFDWLTRSDLDEQFGDKAHLRNHLMVTLNRHFDDLEVDADVSGGFYAKDSSGELRYIPESKKFEWLEAEQDRIDDVLSEFPDFNSATKYPDEYQIPGGENYREILYKLPDDKVEGRFRPPPGHFDNAENTFGSIRATDRTIDGTPTLFAEEIQSDWAIAGAKKGYTSGEEVAAKSAKLDDLKAQYDQALEQFTDASARFNLRTPADNELELIKDMRLANDQAEALREEIKKLGEIGVPDNPFRGNWYKPVINNFLVKAAKEGKGGIGFPTGPIVSSRYGLSQIVDEINVVGRTDAVTGEKSRSVGIDTVDGQRIQFGVDNNGKIDSVRFQDHARFVGKGLDEVIGKSLAKKIMEGGPQTISGEGLKIGGEGKDKFYDDMLPKHLNEIGKRYGVQLEKRTIPFGESGKKESEVYFMPITEEMRREILSEGLPMFKQGGSVKKFAPGGKVMKGIAKGAERASADVKKAGKLSKLKEDIRQDMGNYGAMRVERAAEREANLNKFLSDSKIKERLYHATPKDFTEFKPGGSDPAMSGPAIWLTPDATKQPAAHNVGGHRGVFREGTNVMPVYVQAKNPLVLDDPTMIEWAREVFADGSTSFPELMPQKWVDEVRKEGYDSIMLADPYKRGYTPEIIMFEPTQIKSAIGNRGSFDPNDPDITKAKGGPLRSVTSGAQRAAKEGQKMLQGVYRGYTGERLEEPVLSTTPQKRVAEYYANRRAATRGEDPHVEMLMVDPFVGKEYGLALPIDEFNRELLTTRARAIAPSDVVERTQLKKKGGLACLSK